MKLINPVGRDITTFSTEVSRCACKCGVDYNAAYSHANGTHCSCNCIPYYTKNENANSSDAYTAVADSHS